MPLPLPLPTRHRVQTATETHADPPLEMLSDEDDLFPGLGGGGGDGDLSLLRLLTRLRFTGDGSPSNIDIVQLLAAAAGASSLGDEAADMMAAVSVLDAELAGMRHREGGRAGATQSTAGAEGQPGGQPPEKQAEVVTTRQAATRAAFTHALVWDSLSLGDAAGDAAFEALMEANR